MAALLSRVSWSGCFRDFLDFFFAAEGRGEWRFSGPPRDVREGPAADGTGAVVAGVDEDSGAEAATPVEPAWSENDVESRAAPLKGSGGGTGAREAAGGRKAAEYAACAEGSVYAA